eukprot:763385-Hanusia_phi.AAC.3
MRGEAVVEHDEKNGGGGEDDDEEEKEEKEVEEEKEYEDEDEDDNDDDDGGDNDNNDGPDIGRSLWDISLRTRGDGWSRTSFHNFYSEVFPSNPPSPPSERVAQTLSPLQFGNDLTVARQDSSEWSPMNTPPHTHKLVCRRLRTQARLRVSHGSRSKGGGWSEAEILGKQEPHGRWGGGRGEEEVAPVAELTAGTGRDQQRHKEDLARPALLSGEFGSVDRVIEREVWMCWVCLMLRRQDGEEGGAGRGYDPRYSHASILLLRLPVSCPPPPPRARVLLLPPLPPLPPPPNLHVQGGHQKAISRILYTFGRLNPGIRYVQV